MKIYNYFKKYLNPPMKVINTQLFIFIPSYFTFELLWYIPKAWQIVNTCYLTQNIKPSIYLRFC